MKNWRSYGPIDPTIFLQELRAVNSPLLSEWDQILDIAGEHSALVAGILAEESQYGTAFNLNVPANRNPANLRPRGGSGYLKFTTYTACIFELVSRITDPFYAYRDTVSLLDLIRVYAPASDSNRPEEYVANILTRFARWGVDSEEEPPVDDLRIILNPGHRNTTGGNTEEQAMTPALAQSYFDAFTAAGYEVVNLGDTSGGLDETSRRMAAAIASAPGDCVLLDLHYEGSPAPGVFCIVPDVTGLSTNAPVAQDPNDTWANNTIDRALARAISNRISAATGLTLRTGIREPGIMDESETGVGADGWRLATFAYTSPHRNRSVRLVVEHGNHTIQPDRSIILSPDFTDRCAAAVVAAVLAVYGTPETEEPVEPTPAKGPHVPGKLNWQRGDVGLGTYKDTPVLQFVVELTATKRTTPRVAASGKAKTCSSAIEVGETRVAIGALDSGWGFLEDGSRIFLEYFTPEVPRPRDTA